MWVPEYGREYCEKLQAAGVDLWKYQWRSEGFVEIAHKQREVEDRLAREANRILICDTDVLSTGIWHERYMKTRSAEVERIADAQRHHLYLLTDCDLPFVQDGLRDGESIREWMTHRFEQVMTERGLAWVRMSGCDSQRLESAIHEVDKLLTQPRISSYRENCPVAQCGLSSVTLCAAEVYSCCCSMRCKLTHIFP